MLNCIYPLFKNNSAGRSFSVAWKEESPYLKLQHCNMATPSYSTSHGIARNTVSTQAYLSECSSQAQRESSSELQLGDLRGICRCVLVWITRRLFQVETECFIPAAHSHMHIIFVTPVNKHL